jgi:HSP20 family protein
MPGLRKEDIKVDIDRDQITITTEVKQHDQKIKNERVVQTERYHGSCSRTFRFPSQIDSIASHASYENGVLHLMIPKRATTAGKRLAIN